MAGKIERAAQRAADYFSGKTLGPSARLLSMIGFTIGEVAAVIWLLATKP